DALDPLGHALRARAEETGVLDLLEGLAIALVARDIAHKQHHRSRILECRMPPDRSIGRTRTAGDEAHARTAGQLAMRFRHESGAAFLAVDDEADLFAIGVKAIQHGQVAFAGHAKSVRRALRHQAFHNQVTGELAHVLTRLTFW